MNLLNRNPNNAADWGPSVRFVYTLITESSTGQLEIGSLKNGNIVTAVKFADVGVNSKVFVGKQNGPFEEIPRPGAAEISFGTGFPHCIEAEFLVKFEVIDDAEAYEHKCLVVETVVNCK